MEIDFHAKNQVNICKLLGKKSGKLKLTDGRPDGRTDRWTKCKPIVPFGFAGWGLKKGENAGYGYFDFSPFPVLFSGLSSL